MSSGGVAVRQHVVPPDLLALSSVRADYCDLFTADASAAPDLSPEQWARAAVEHASPAGRFLAWRMLCHLRLATESSSTHIGGWRIGARGDDWIRLEASSWFMTANMVFKAARAAAFRHVRAVRRAGRPRNLDSGLGGPPRGGTGIPRRGCPVRDTCAHGRRRGGSDMTAAT